MSALRVALAVLVWGMPAVAGKPLSAPMPDSEPQLRQALPKVLDAARARAKTA